MMSFLDMRTLPPSAMRVVICMILTITLVIVVTEVLQTYFHSSEVTEGIVHIFALSGVLAPLFYWFWFRPLTHQMTLLRNSEEEIRHLSHQLLKVGESERHKLALDLHDEFGQKITSLQILFDGLQQNLHERQQLPPDICRPLISLVSGLSNDLRSFLADLRPAALHDLGLVPTLEGLCEEIGERQPSMKIDFRSAGINERLHPDLEIVLFRACQEALTNIVKHARAGRVEVRLSRSYPRVILTVQDDGIGVPSSITAQTGFRTPGKYGLLGMRERVVSVGGSIRMSRIQDGGTRIRIEVPESLPIKGAAS